MPRSKGYVVVLKGKTGKLESVDCADLDAVEKALAAQAVEPEDVFVFPSQPVEIRRAITIAKAPRKPRAKANGAPKPKQPTVTAPPSA